MNTSLQPLLKAVRRPRSMDALLTGFLMDIRAHPDAKVHARTLHHMLNNRHSRLLKPGEEFREQHEGVMFGANVLLIEPESEMGLLHPHPRMDKILPFGGTLSAADHGDPLAAGLRELLEETGNDNDEATSPLYAYRAELRWLTQPVLGVNYMANEARGKSGVWWFLTLGMLLPRRLYETVRLPPGNWYALGDIRNMPDVPTARAAGMALHVLRARRS